MIMKKLILLITLFCFCFEISFSQNTSGSKPRILIFTKTNGYYHESIPSGVSAITKLGNENNFSVESTANAGYFREDTLKNYAAVIFLSTTGDVLNGDQQVAFERFIQGGGGFAGIHSATDTEYDWPWYHKLVGAYFANHPKLQKATINVIDKNHLSTSFLPDKWERFDEWYNFKNVQSDIKVLARLDESTYEGGTMGTNHPHAWYHNFDGGRAFYTAGGHTKESYSEPLFLRHLLGGIQYALDVAGGVLPVTLSSIKAYENNQGVQIEWTTQQETNVDRYEVERSENGQQFSKLESIKAKGNSNVVTNYNFFDAHPFAGKNFYRIKIIDLSSKVTYSQVTKMNIINNGPAMITLYPNPVVGNTVVLQMNNLQKGNYQVILTNEIGQRITAKMINHPGGSATQTIELSKIFAPGIYQLKFSGEKINMILEVLKK
jgi:type 1 glutamine amidotransferase